MEIPVIKTLLVYTNNENMETKKVLCDYLEVDENDKFSKVNFQNEIMNRSPFEFEGYPDSYACSPTYGECVIKYCKSRELKEYFVDVTVKYVLEYRGKIFELKETSYDMKEYEF